MSRGDTGALAKVYERTHAALYGFSLFLLKNPQDAEDAVQETFVKAYQSAAQYRSQGKPMAWLMTIARNEALQLLREPPHRGHDTGGLAGAVFRQAGLLPGGSADAQSPARDPLRRGGR